MFQFLQAESLSITQYINGNRKYANCQYSSLVRLEAIVKDDRVGVLLYADTGVAR
jgi:hypothetical protein